MFHRSTWLLGAALASFTSWADARAQETFVNWENPHVYPLDITPDGTRLVAVNTADNRVEVFDITSGTAQPLFDVPVGLDPVSVRARTDDEVWVVNHISDSVSIVDLETRNVVATLDTLDEPADVVFAGNPQRAFVSCSQANSVQVFDPSNLAAGALATLPIQGEDPRALAVGKGGRKVFVAIFESGNGSTILGGGIDGNNTLAFPPNVVNEPATPYGGVNPPPNDGAGFKPAKNPNTPTPPPVGLIVKKDEAGNWLDDNGTDWSQWVTGVDADMSGRIQGWDLVDHDVAIIDTTSFDVSYVKRLMNINMAIATNPRTGNFSVVGTDGINEVRFEPNIKGIFTRVLAAQVRPQAGEVQFVDDLNQHLAYDVPTVDQSERDKSVGDPRGIVWDAAGEKAYITGMGSNNLVVVDESGQRVGLADTIAVGEGPTGIVLDESRERLYVMNKFEGSISVVDVTTELEVGRVPFYDPTPDSIRVGRKHLYDTHETSGLGQVSCASCHVDARMDRLAWDLGDPSANQKATTGINRGAGIPGLTFGFQPWHPMKGPMATQTMQDIIGHEPLHWRGDRFGLEEFNDAFMGLQGDDETLTPSEMQEFEDFLDSVSFPPNPFRDFENKLPRDLELTGITTPGRFGPAGLPMPNGDAVRGLQLYRPPFRLDGGAFACVTCHTLPTGMGADAVWNGSQYVPIPPGPDGERHHAAVAVDGSTNITIKIPQLRNGYEKGGFDASVLENTAGFAILHDGSVDTLARFVAEPAFNVTSVQDVADLTAFLLAFSGSDLPEGQPNNLLEPPGPPSQDTHAAVGSQTTLVDAAQASIGQKRLIDGMLGLAERSAIGVVVKGKVAGEQRGYYYDAANKRFQSDKLGEKRTATELADLAQPGAELTYTVVPFGSEVRIGVDRDLDGFFDRDEITRGTDPADPNSHP